MSTNQVSLDRNEEEGDEMDLFVLLVNVVGTVVRFWHELQHSTIARDPLPDNDNLRRAWLHTLYNGSEADCIENLRLSKSAFTRLCQVLEEGGGLVQTGDMSIREGVGMFLYILGHHLEFRVIQKTFFHSTETIGQHFRNVLQAVMKVHKYYLKSHECVLGRTDAENWHWFENAIGALDGTLIPVTVSASDQRRYRDRKGEISTNVLGVCDPELYLVYALAGWEGSAFDSQVLQDAMYRHKFIVPRDKYYLVDDGYENAPRFLAPYRDTRYHLKEWSGSTPQDYKELFNLRHSSARNVIERVFGVMKKRWSILRHPSFFNIKTQTRIINACCILHNYILLHERNDSIPNVEERSLSSELHQEIANQEDGGRDAQNITTYVESSTAWMAFRDETAKKMCDEYQSSSDCGT